VADNDTRFAEWRISGEAYDWAEAEQARLQKAVSETLSQAELFDRMRAVYEAAEWQSPDLDRSIPSRHQHLVDEFVRLLEDDDPKFRAFRDTVVGVLSDRLDAGRQVSTR
jgi:hypothetical protein